MGFELERGMRLSANISKRRFRILGFVYATGNSGEKLLKGQQERIEGVMDSSGAYEEVRPAEQS